MLAFAVTAKPSANIYPSNLMIRGIIFPHDIYINNGGSADLGHLLPGNATKLRCTSAEGNGRQMLTFGHRFSASPDLKARDRCADLDQIGSRLRPPENVSTVTRLFFLSLKLFLFIPGTNRSVRWYNWLHRHSADVSSDFSPVAAVFLCTLADEVLAC